MSPAWTPDPHRPAGTHHHSTNNRDKTTINSPLLFEMLKKLSLTEQCTVLDMGRACQSSIDFFSDYWCKLFITDTISELFELNSKTDDAPQAWLKSLDRTINLYQQEKPNLDMILLWSLPNYLSPGHLKTLIEYLLRGTSRGIKLHTYIYNTQMMPAAPASYHINRDRSVALSPVSSEQKTCPLYHLAELHSCFNPFKVEHAVMLSSGIQEYVFSR